MNQTTNPITLDTADLGDVEKLTLALCRLMAWREDNETKLQGNDPRTIPAAPVEV